MSAGNSLATPPANLRAVRLLSGGGGTPGGRPGSRSSGGGPSPPAAPGSLPGRGSGPLWAMLNVVDTPVFSGKCTVLRGA